jgi:hypothetical protein
VVSVPHERRDSANRREPGRAHAQGQAYRRPAGARPDRQSQGGPEAARTLLDPDHGRHLRGLGHRPARRDDGGGAGERD